MNRRKQVRILRRVIIAANHCVDVIDEIDPDVKELDSDIEYLEEFLLAVIGMSLNIISTLTGKPYLTIKELNKRADYLTLMTPNVDHSDQFKSQVTTTGFTIQIFNTSGSDVGGNVDWLEPMVCHDNGSVTIEGEVVKEGDAS